MTTAEMLRTEGRAEGRNEGRNEGRAEALRQLLTLKFGALQDETLERIRSAPADRLEVWTARLLTAATLDEVLD